MNLAVIVPYRDRAAHLAAFVPAMAAFLDGSGRSDRNGPRTGSAFTSHHVYVVEQLDAKPFNRGKLLNVGFRLVADATLLGRALGHTAGNFTHAVLHDVDMLPQEVAYTAVERPTHLAGAASQFKHALPYPEYFGGVTLFPVADFRRVNGYNNDYWGWGCEDDDLLDRCAHHAVPVDRVAGRFESLPHAPSLNDPRNGKSYGGNLARLLRNRQVEHEYATNGLNSLAFTFQGSEALGEHATKLKVEL